MNRNEAIQHLNSVRKVELPPTEELPTRSGMVGQAGGVLRIRDRQDIAIATQEVVAPKPKTQRELDMEEWAAHNKKHEDAEKAEQTERERKRKERRAAEDRKRWQQEDDERTKKEIAERQARIFSQNMTRSEVREILADCTGEEIVEILKRVDAASCKGFAPAYQTFKDEVRAEKHKKDCIAAEKRRVSSLWASASEEKKS